MIKNIISSFLAGLMISIGAIVYLSCPDKIVGAVLFSIGLITILEFKLSLYTGKVGYLRSVKQIPQTMLVLLGNAVGCTFITLFANTLPDVWSTRLEAPLYLTFAKAIICGILIYVCVEQHEKKSLTDSLIITLIAIPAFILCGAEHSVADICFMIASKNISLRGVLLILLIAIGNATGSLIMSLWSEKQK